MKLLFSCCLLLVGASLAACSLLSPQPPSTPTPNTMPNDFQIEYEWVEGSLPPPHHYEITVRLDAAGNGEVIMWPDYPGDGVPSFSESFTASAGDVQALYDLMASRGLFSLAWQAADLPPVGGSAEWMTVRANGQTIEVPAYVAAEQAAPAAEMYAALRALVPPATWARLESQRQEYVDAYQE